MKTIAYSLMAVALFVAVRANAQQTMAAPQSSACQQDVATLCKGVQPNANQLGDCLIGNVDKISNSQCKTSISQLAQAEQSAKSACSSDIQSKCANKGGVDMLDCLHQNAGSVSSGCKSALPK